MTIPLTIKAGTTRNYPEDTDRDYAADATNWAVDVTNAINAAPAQNQVPTYDAVVGTAAQVVAGFASHSDINTAIAAVAAGSIIGVLKNTYTLAAKIVINKKILVVGQGPGTILTSDAGIAAGPIVEITAAGAQLHNVAIAQGAGTPDSAVEIDAALTDVVVANVAVSGAFGTSEFVDGSTSTIVSSELIRGVSMTLANPLPITSGGTGQITANAAFNALAPSQAAANGKYLKSDGTNTAWDALDISTADITGTLPIANGGTGQTIANSALNALLPAQAANAGKYLKTDATNTSWDAIDVSSADISGVLPIANGGTGAATANAAANAILPAQGGNAGKYLKTNATDTAWDAIDISTSDISGVVKASNGGTGVANNDAATLTRSGNHDLKLTTTGATDLTLPAAGTLATLAGAEVLENKTIEATSVLVDTTDNTKTLKWNLAAQQAGVDITLTTGAEAADRVLNVPVLGADRTLVMTDLAQVLENKTLEATCALVDTADNTKTIKWNLAAQSAGVDLTVTSGSETADRVINIPVLGSDRTLAFTDLTQTFENKTLDASTVGGTANDGTDGFTLYKDQSAAPAAPGGDDVKIYAKDGKLRLVNAITDKEVGSGGGQGELNYITNSSGTDDAAAAVPTGWVASDNTDLTVAVTKTAAELPREVLIPSGIKILSADAAATGDLIYFDFTLDDVDLNKVLKIEFARKVVATYAAGELAIYIAAQTDRTVALHTPQVTDIPASDGVFGTTFNSASTAALSLVFYTKAAMAIGDGIVISNVIVGPGQLIQGAAIGRIGSLVWTIGNWTLTSQANECWRVGDRLVGELTVVYASGSGVLTLSPPSGYTIDSSRVPTGANMGTALIVDAGTVANNKVGVVTLVSGALRIQSTDGSDVSSTNPFTFASGDSIRINFDIPITEWSSGVYLGSGADGTSVLDWTATTMSPVNAGSTSTVTAYVRRVGDTASFSGVINVTGTMGTGSVGLSLPSGYVINTSKIPGTAYNATLGLASVRNTNGTNYQSGVVVYENTTSVDFLAYKTDGTYATATNLNQNTNIPITFESGDFIYFEFSVPIVGWTSANYLGKMLTGFASCGVARSGIVNNDSSNTGGNPIKGRTDGVADSAGYVGEYVEAAGSATSATTDEWNDGGSAGIALTAGTWDLQATVVFDPASGTTTTGLQVCIGTVSGNNSTGLDTKRNQVKIGFGGGITGTATHIMASPVFRVTISSTTTYYPKGFASFSASTMTIEATLIARRIA